ncbi:Uncharacterised protein [Acinetobacter johnsonii]|nr:hypothetical protein [Acinetobacter johnsonii]SNU14154.1 Uncharacterised protein [Acinetobacter johnsonii]
MDIQETIDIRYEEIEGLKQNLSEDHYMNPEQEDELEELITKAIKFGELCAKRDAKAQAVPEGFVLVEKKEFEQMQEFEDLYRRAIFNSKKSIHEVNWSHVSNLGVGSTRAKAMCKRFNIDPEATFRKPQEPTND